MSKIASGTSRGGETNPTSGRLEDRVAAPAHAPIDATAGTNNGGFENRVAPSEGTVH